VNCHVQVAMGQAVKENFLNPVILIKGNYHVTVKKLAARRPVCGGNLSPDLS
jgi:hypothetical protein